jgi:protein-tyrosine phosphatase
LLERVSTEPWLTIGGQGRYVLGMAVVPGQLWPPFLDELIFRFLLIGVIPIICHPERLSAVQSNPETLRGAVARGARLQITAGSLTRSVNSTIRTCTRRLLRAGLVSLVASDVHGPGDVFPSQVAPELARIVGSEAAQRILVDNPARVLAGEEIPAPALTEPRGILSLLGRLTRVGKRSTANNIKPMEAVR